MTEPIGQTLAGQSMAGESSAGESLSGRIKYNADGLVPAIAQCAETGDVLMLAWMNAESLAMTLATRRVVYFSRSRQELWEKGATSGHSQHLLKAVLDCDGDTILLTVKQKGAACHTGERTCFFTPLIEGQDDSGQNDSGQDDSGQDDD